MNVVTRSDIIGRRAAEVRRLLECCCLCGHRCGVNRLEGEVGACRGPLTPVVASWTAHHGEEPVFSGTRGSGTIFFAYCNLRCVFCQNSDISQLHGGREVSERELVGIMMGLQEKGCHNINLVSPTHFMPQIMEALVTALASGLDIPLLYNTNGYDSPELLKALDGIVDIYMPDLKYLDESSARRYSQAPRYVEAAKKAIREMFRQVGDLELDEEGVAVRGLLVRHLVLPGDIARSGEVLRFLALVSKKMWVGIMSQYSPQYRAGEFPELTRRLTPEEYYEVVRTAEELGLENALIQHMSSTAVYLPDFRKRDPFEHQR